MLVSGGKKLVSFPAVSNWPSFQHLEQGSHQAFLLIAAPIWLIAAPIRLIAASFGLIAAPFGCGKFR